MYDDIASGHAGRLRAESRIRLLAGGARGAIVWTGEGRATVLGPDGEPFLRVEATDAAGQHGIRVVRLERPRPAVARAREGSAWSAGGLAEPG